MFRTFNVPGIRALLGALVLVILVPSANARATTILYAFQGGSDGASPQASLIADTADNLYGTTY